MLLPGKMLAAPQLRSPGCAIRVFVLVLGVVGCGNAKDGHQDAQHSHVDEVAYTLQQVGYTCVSYGCKADL